MNTIAGAFSQSDWNAAVSQFADLSLLQTWEYAETASRTRALEVSRLLFKEEGKLIGAVQGLVRPIPYVGGGAVVINRGPLWQCQAADPSRLAAILSALRDYWVTEKNMYLRVAPAIRAGEIPKSLFQQAGYDLAEYSHPWVSARLDLTLPVESLRRSLRSNWNASLKKAESAGIVLESGPGETLLNQVRIEYAQLLGKRKFDSPITPEFLQIFQDQADDQHKLWTSMAKYRDRSLGGIVLARYGSICEYLIGAVNEEGKRLNAGQLLLWSAILDAKDRGYRWFDLGGMDPGATAKGVLYFKRGLNAPVYELMGDFEAYSSGLINKAIRWKLEHTLRALAAEQ